MQSIEQTADLGEDVINMSSECENTNTKKVPRKITPPGRNLVFGDLFELKSSQSVKLLYTTTSNLSIGIRGPSQCLIYICKLCCLLFAGLSD